MLTAHAVKKLNKIEKIWIRMGSGGKSTSYELEVMGLGAYFHSFCSNSHLPTRRCIHLRDTMA